MFLVIYLFLNLSAAYQLSPTVALKDAHQYSLDAISLEFQHLPIKKLIINSFAEPLLNQIDQLWKRHYSLKSDPSIFFQDFSELTTSFTGKWTRQVWNPISQNLKLENSKSLAHISSKVLGVEKRNIDTQKASAGLRAKFSALGGFNWIIGKLGSVVIGSVLAAYFLITIFWFGPGFYNYLRSNTTA